MNLIIFDYEDTLTDQENAVLVHYPRALTRYMTKQQSRAFRHRMEHINPGDKVVLTIHGRELQMVAGGVWTLLGGYAQGCGLSPGKIKKAYEETQVQIQPFIRLRSGIRGIFRRYKAAGWTIIVLSNAPTQLMVRKLHDLSLWHYISECRGNARKPNVDAYVRIKKKYRLHTKDNVVSVGDDVLFDLVPAKQTFKRCRTVYVRTRFGIVRKELQSYVDFRGLHALRGFLKGP